jgi:hypothetical protein
VGKIFQVYQQVVEKLAFVFVDLGLIKANRNFGTTGPCHILVYISMYDVCNDISHKERVRICPKN